MPSRALTLSLCALAVACSPIPARRPAAHTTAPSVPAIGPPGAPAGPSRPAGEARPAGPAIMTAEVRGTAPACAFASLGFDHRALPTSTSAEGYDGWVRGEADAIRRAAPAAAPPRMFVEPGSGSVHALFDGATDEEVLARCEQTVAAYLLTAPQLPLIGFGSAAHVTTPCGPCP